MIKNVTVQLSTFEIAMFNQAMGYYKGQISMIIAAAEEQPNFNAVEFIDRLYWLKTEAGALQAKITSGISSEQLPMSQYHPRKF